MQKKKNTHTHPKKKLLYYIKKEKGNKRVNDFNLKIAMHLCTCHLRGIDVTARDTTHGRDLYVNFPFQESEGVREADF